jgi:hypothetical protein
MEVYSGVSQKPRKVSAARQQQADSEVRGCRPCLVILISIVMLETFCPSIDCDACGTWGTGI